MYYYMDYIEDLRKLIKKGNGVLKIVDYSISYDGRKIFALKLGNGKIRGIVSAGVHGREYINTPVVLKVIDKMIIDYKKRDNLILDNNSIIIVPLVNPDGYEIATRGYNSINNGSLRNICKKKNIDCFKWKYNARAIDINRNFQSKLWKRKYAGDVVFSEVESWFLKKIMDKYNGGIYVDIHSRGENIYYYRETMNEEYNSRQFFIANRLSELTGYRMSEPKEEVSIGDSGGNTVHYYSETYGLPAITIETIKEDEKFPLNVSLIDKVYVKLEELLVELIIGSSCF